MAATQVTINEMDSTAGAIAGAWKSWTASPTGFSGTPTVSVSKYTQVGKTVTLLLDVSGTSNSSSFGFTLPVTCKNSQDFTVRIVDNTSTYAVGLIETTANTTTANVYVNMDGTTFTASGTKRLILATITYEAA